MTKGAPGTQGQLARDQEGVDAERVQAAHGQRLFRVERARIDHHRARVRPHQPGQVDHAQAVQFGHAMPGARPGLPALPA
jgi:hypothetical protein